MREIQVILVDEDDTAIGVGEKIEVHKKGLLHRAFSLFHFNENGDMLLQKRAASKYHSPGLWTNACCSHPLPDETLEGAVIRRTKEELGMDIWEPKKVFEFTYRAKLEGGMIEHEYDHVFISRNNAIPIPNPAEVSDVKFATIASIVEGVKRHPEEYTAWFKIALPKLQSVLEREKTLL